MATDLIAPPPVTPPASNKVHFLKEIINNPIVVEGKGIAFEPIGGGRGLLELDPNDPGHAKIIDALNEFYRRGVGGVAKITAMEYAEKKSLPPVMLLGRQRERLRVAPRGPGPKPNPGPTEATGAPVVKPTPPTPLPPAAEAAEVPVAELAEKYEGFRPPTRRISRKPEADKKASSLP